MGKKKKKKQLPKDKKDGFSYAQRKKSQKAVSSLPKKYVIMLMMALRKKILPLLLCSLFSY